jgi:hypothetical protein
MLNVVEIVRYQYYTYSSRDSSVAQTVILLYSGSGYLASVYFSTEEEPLRPAEQFSNGTYGLYYDYQELQIVLDMLRNEKPVYLIYNGARNTRLSTAPEPVGEGEE